MTRFNFLFTFAVLGLVVCVSQTSHADVVLGQVDAFTSGTADDWQEGNNTPNPPFYDGGAGSDGNAGHLGNVSDGGGGPGSRWLMFNDDSRWSGDYLSQGINAVRMFVDNRSGNGNSADLRIGLDGAGGWFVSNAIVLGDGSGWTELEFQLATMTYVANSGGTGILDDTLTDATRFEIVSSASPLYRSNGDLIQGDATAFDLRIDNISAIPEPGAFGFMAMFGLVGFLRRRK